MTIEPTSTLRRCDARRRVHYARLPLRAPIDGLGLALLALVIVASLALLVA